MAAVVKVVIVDDSTLCRVALRRILTAEAGFSIVGEATNGADALQLIEQQQPDIVLMDIVMPKLDGLQTTRELMRTAARPVLIISDLIGGNADLSFEALRAGALEVISKPSAKEFSDPAKIRELQRKVRMLSEVPVITRHGYTKEDFIPPLEPTRSAAAVPSARPAATARPCPEKVSLICIGASTGGPPLLQRILVTMGTAPACPILVVQHMTPGFTTGMVSWLRKVSGLEVVIAEDGVTPKPGTVYVAADGHHLELDGWSLRLNASPAVSGHRPSIDSLFLSVAAGSQARTSVAVLLTGMGSDGARGLLKLRRAGGWTISQDEASSVVYGMPKAAADLDAACEILSADEVSIQVAVLARGQAGVRP